MPVKSAQSQRIKVGRSSPKTAPKTSLDQEEIAVPIPSKIKAPLDLDETEALVIPEEKVEEDPLAAESESEEVGLDEAGMEEEIDPFNDKWEV
jgi:hypothetical protein